MATHSNSPLARIPWTEKPGGLQSTGQQGRTQPKRLSTHTVQKLLVEFGGCFNPHASNLIF